VVTSGKIVGVSGKNFSGTDASRMQPFRVAEVPVISGMMRALRVEAQNCDEHLTLSTAPGISPNCSRWKRKSVYSDMTPPGGIAGGVLGSGFCATIASVMTSKRATDAAS
jgi:hypothetical protein